MSNPTIFPLFSTPVYVNNVGDFERPDLNALEYASSHHAGGPFGFLSSTDRKVLDRPDFSHVRDIVMKEVNRLKVHMHWSEAGRKNQKGNLAGRR